MGRRALGGARERALELVLGRMLGVALAIACAAPLLLGTTARAQDSEYEREGAYLGLAGVFALANTGKQFSNLGDTGGVNFQAGYRLAPSASLELFGEWLYFGNENPGFFGLTLKLYLPELFGFSLADGRIQPYAVGSSGFALAEDSRNNIDFGGNFRGGLGCDFYLTEDLALYGQVHYSGSGGVPSGLDSTNFLAGAIFRF
jgi:hypothetical protein